MTSRKYHIFILTLCVFILATSFVLEVRGEKLYFQNNELSGGCFFKESTHIDCPGCGLTRSIVSVRNLNIEKSIWFHPSGWLIFLLIILQVPYRLICLKIKDFETYKHIKLIEKSGRFLLAVVIVTGIIRYFV